MPWLVNIVDRDHPVRRAAPPAVQARKEELLALWREHIGPVAEGGDGDYEDFWEQAARLEAAVSGLGRENIWLTLSTDREETAVHLGTGERRPTAELGHLPKYGAQSSRRHRSVGQEQALLADAYWRYEAFRSRAGRRFEICGFSPEDGGTDIRDVLAGFAADGVTKAFVKVNLNKYATFPVDLEGVGDFTSIGNVLDPDTVWSLIYLEGSRESLQVQEFVTMEYEYRIFVVDQQPVTGAGCIEEHTPLDNNGNAFDTRLRRDRSEKSQVEPAPDIAGMLTGYARQAIEALAKEVPDLKDYVIDVAMGAGLEPLVVELNPLLNSGLYASQPSRVTEAMAAREREAVS
jgi:hypothetical protein